MTAAPRPAGPDEPDDDPQIPAEETPQVFHLLQEGDAQIVETPALLQAHMNIADTIESRAMMCIYGDAGFGKTLSTRAALKAVAPEQLLWLQFRSRPTPRDIRLELFNAMHLQERKPTRPAEFDTLLKEALTRRQYTIVCDEAQQLRRECFEFIRHLWDTGSKDRRPAVVFVGGIDAYKTLRSEPALASRVYIWQKFKAMDHEDVLKIIPLFHTVWADAPSEVIDMANKTGCHGSFRNWSTLTATVLKGLKIFNKDKVDEALVRWALRRMLGEE